MAIAAIYEHDFYAWLTSNAQLLREQRIADVDIDHIAEELESMGKSEKRALLSRFTVLLAHLLKWQFQPAKRSRSWKNTILTQRIDIHELLEESPSLRHDLAEKLGTRNGNRSAAFSGRLPVHSWTTARQRFFPGRSVTRGQTPSKASDRFDGFTPASAPAPFHNTRRTAE